ncbi:MAG: FAD-binding protein [Rhizobium sp.]|nr:FAD-binding protein [Rhizobium sp.]
MTGMPQTNWAKSYGYHFRDCTVPSSLDEVRSVVAGSARIKALGSRHSFNPIADGEKALILDSLPLDPRLSDDRRSASIAGHATYGDLSRFLASHDLAVHNLASLPHISIAGAIATATHGSGSGHGNLATAVSALEFVAADGSIVKVRRGDPDFEGMVVHLGVLGIVTRVTLDVLPAFEITQTVYEGLTTRSLCDNLDAILDGGYSVSAFTTWRDDSAQIWVKDTPSIEPVPGTLHGATRATLKRHPILGMDPVNATDQFSVAGAWSDRLPHFKMGFTPSNGDEIQSEFHVPRRHGAAAILALAKIRDQLAPMVQVNEFRAVAADDLWMSPQYERDTLSLHFTWLPDEAGVKAAVHHVEEALAPFEPLPHWGKVFSPAPVGAHYAKLAQFEQLRRRLDPTGKFSNPWIEEIVFGRAAVT